MSRNGSAEWTAPNGNKYAFKFSLEKHFDASTVTCANGEIILISKVTCNGSKDTNDDNDSNSSSSRSTKKSKTEEEVGRLNGYILKRRNTNFHYDADAVDSELQEFATSLFESDGVKTRVPSSPILSNTIPSKGGMLLIETVEIKLCCRGMDMGLYFLHEFLKFVKDKVGICVMKPWTLSESGLKYKDNKERMSQVMRGKCDEEDFNLSRCHSIQLRKHLTRMGFHAIQNTPEYEDMWIISMDKYKSNSVDPQTDWMSKEESRQLADIPIPDEKYVESHHDKRLKEVLKGIFEDPFAHSSNSNSMLGAVQQQMAELNKQFEQMKDMMSIIGDGGIGSDLNKRLQELTNMINLSAPVTKLTQEVKDQIKTLVDQGANLQGINALHMAAANYKTDDLFEYLTGEFGLNLNSFDRAGNTPLHVAVGCHNLPAAKVLLRRGLDKNSTNKDGLTPKEVMEKQEESMQDFSRVMGLGAGAMMGIPFGTGNASTAQELKRLLR